MHIGSFSKTVSPWLPLAYLALPRSSWLHGALVGLDSERDASTSGPMQAALAAFMASGGFWRHLTRSRRRYAHRRQFVQTFVESIDWGDVSGLDGGLHLALPVPAAEVAAALLEQGLLVATLHEYALSGQSREQALVLGDRHSGDLEFVGALELIDRTVRRLRGRSGSGTRSVLALAGDPFLALQLTVLVLQTNWRPRVERHGAPRC